MEKTEAISVYVSSNDIGSGKCVDEIASEMEYLLTIIKSQGIQPIISMVQTGNDKHAYKVPLVNNMLRDLCVQYNIGYIDNTNIKIEHLNPGGVHIQKQFNYMFTDNLTKYFNMLCGGDIFPNDIIGLKVMQ